MTQSIMDKLRARSAAKKAEPAKPVKVKGGMNSFTAIVGDKRAAMITHLDYDEAVDSCRDRFGARFTRLIVN